MVDGDTVIAGDGYEQRSQHYHIVIGVADFSSGGWNAFVSRDVAVGIHVGPYHRLHVWIGFPGILWRVKHDRRPGCRGRSGAWRQGIAAKECSLFVGEFRPEVNEHRSRKVDARRERSPAAYLQGFHPQVSWIVEHTLYGVG
jgi:hypothetical protein